MHTIKVDDDIFAYLQARGRPFVDEPNDVLRRELLGDDPSEPVVAKPSRRPGSLMSLLRAGLIAADDKLIYIQPRRHNVFHASVTADGWITVDGTDYDKPTPSLRECVGTAINGWLWVHEPTGKTLDQLRKEI